jgi:hypothetical protein
MSNQKKYNNGTHFWALPFQDLTEKHLSKYRPIRKVHGLMNEF